jgi:hypothetical protein
MFQIAIVFLSAISISIVSGYFSITGMTSLFGGATYWAIVAMMCVLEFGKIIAATWLHANWQNPAVSFLHKSYLSLAVIALMLITAMGIYGYLAKGFLDQQIPMGAISLQIAQKERQIETDKGNIQRLTDRQTQLDAAVTSLVEQKYVVKSLAVRTQQKTEREQIAADLLTAQKDIDQLSADLVPIKMRGQDQDSKLGPIKFVADLFGWTRPDEAVRMVILTLMFAFDPLAVVLVLSGAISVREYFKRDKPVLRGRPRTDSLNEGSAALERLVEPRPQSALTAEEDISDKQAILRILQRNPDSIEDILDTVIEYHSKKD